MKDKKRKKIIETKKQIKEIVKNQILPSLEEDVEKVVNSGFCDDELLQCGNYLLAKLIIYRFCVLNPFAPVSKTLLKKFKEAEKL